MFAVYNIMHLIILFFLEATNKKYSIYCIIDTTYTPVLFKI